MKNVFVLGLGMLLLSWQGPRAAAQGKEEVAALLKQLQGTDPAAQTRAAEALAKLGPDAKDSVPLLIEALHKARRETDTAPAIARALAGIGPAAVPALIEALKREDALVQSHAALALKQIGPPAKEAVPALMEVVKKDRTVGLNPAGSLPSPRLPAIGALGRIGPAAKEAVPALIDALKDKEPLSPARIEAAIALGQIGPDAGEAVPVLTEALKEPETKTGPLRWHVATALGRIGPGAKEAVPPLIEMVKDKKLGPARVTAVRALGEIGPAASAAVRPLEEVDEAPLREAARAALAKIQGK